MPDPGHLGEPAGDLTGPPNDQTEAGRLTATVRGRVQGVGFRRYVRSWARKLDLDGWVQNKADGTVRLVAQGKPAALDRLSRLLWGGSPVAQVEAVEIVRSEAQSDDLDSGFEIRR